MQIRFLLGPAGSGKTHRCLADVRAVLERDPEGLPLIFLAPKQATFQIERRLLAGSQLAGYTRLRIASFERLAEFVFDQLRRRVPELLGEEGRIMVLRALLEQQRGQLEVFRASARLPGFARQLSGLLRELQQHDISPSKLESLASRAGGKNRLDARLRDLAKIFSGYNAWLNERNIDDADRLLDLATAAVRESQTLQSAQPLRIEALWLDGFAQMTPQERQFLCAIGGVCESMTLAFCLESEPGSDLPWNSPWTPVAETFMRCRTDLERLPGAEVRIEKLERNLEQTRFSQSPALSWLESNWGRTTLARPPQCGTTLSHPMGEGRGEGTKPLNIQQPTSNIQHPRPQTLSRSPQCGTTLSHPMGEGRGEGRPRQADLFEHAKSSIPQNSALALSETIRVVACATPEAEAEWAAREIRRYVRESGCRYRDVAVLVRSLEPYHDSVRRVFTRYEIPMFLDRRESVSHHPLAELTRYALRLAAFYWEHDDWFGALKTGLAPATDWEIDRLENEALSKGWRGRERWSMPIENAEWLERPRQKVVPPFARFVDALSSSGGKLDGVRLASALRQLWQALGVNRTLERWSSASATLDGLPNPALHETVWQQMLDWLRNIEMAFESASIPLEGWLPIVEAGISNLSAGVIPPSLDQVLVGAIDRSRNPDLKLAIVLGMNEGVFPAPPTSPVLLTRVDREILNSLDAALGPDHWQQAALERYYGYIAMTRSRERLFLTFARRDGQGHELNPSAFIGELKLLCRDLRVEDFAEPESGAPEHWTELAHPLSHNPQPERRAWYLHGGEQVPGWVNAFEQALEAWQIVANPKLDSRLDSALVEAIYGNELQTSVSALEQFAECPFHFFAARGLRALDRPEFEIDRRERGSLQHEILKQFHLNLAREGKKWRDVPPDEARLRIREIGERLIPQYRDGLFAASSTRQFTARVLIENLERVVAVLCGWAAQCGFDPAAVEASFGLSDSVLGGWRIDLENGHALVLRGRIDRVDVCRLEDGAALALVVDYKSSARELDPVLLEHGIELQLIAYLAALSEVGQIEGVFGASRLIPAGAFYIPLRGAGESLRTRNEERAEGAGRAPGYQHRGRFNAAYLDRFDTRGASKGEQFRFTLTKAGVLSKSGNEALNPAEFDALVRRARSFLETHGRDIYSGNVGAAPFRSTKRSACDHCDYRPVCRFDPWTQPFRVLRRGQKEKPDEADR